MAAASVLPTAPISVNQTDAQICAPDAANRVKGFLGTTGEIITSMPNDPVGYVKGLTDTELFSLGEKALRDIADDIIILDEIRNRFRAANGAAILGYQNWREFVERNSRYSVRTIQNRLAEKNGKDISKVNVVTGNQHTRNSPAEYEDEETLLAAQKDISQIEPKTQSVKSVFEDVAKG